MDNEAKLAQEAKPEEVTLFDKIVSREIPANIIYEDDIVSLLIRLYYLPFHISSEGILMLERISRER